MLQNKIETKNIKRFFSGFFLKAKKIWKNSLFKYALSLLKREYYPSNISKRTKWRVNIVRKSEVVNQDIKNQILKKVKSLSLKLSYRNFFLYRIFIFQLAINRILAIIFIIFVGRIINQIPFLNLYPYPNFSKQLPETILVVTGLLILNYRWDMVEEKISEKNQLLIMMLIIIPTVLVLSYIEIHHTRLQYSVKYLIDALSVGTIGVFFLRIISIAFFQLLGFVSSYIDRDIAESIILHHILVLIKGLEENPNTFSDLELKASAIIRLEYLAGAIEKYIPAKLRSRDNNFNRWTKLVMSRISNSVREKKKWILTPKENTKQHLAEYLAHLLFHFLRGDWDELEQLEPLEITRFNLLANRILPTLTQTILLGAIFLFLWWLLTSNFSNEPWISPLITSLVPVIAYLALLLINPLMKDKFDSIKNAVGLF